MATRTLTTKFALDGESEYKSALKAINAELGLHRSELQKAAAQYKDNANSLEALEAKQAALKGVLDDLNARHEQHSSMLEKAKQAQQDYAAKVEELKTKLEALKNSTENTKEQEEKLSAELADAEKHMQAAADSVVYYQTQLNKTERSQAEFSSQLNQTEKYLEEARSSADQCASSIDQYGNEVKQAGENSEDFGSKSENAVNALASALAAAGVAKALEEIAAALRACVDASIEFESAMAGVRRTVGGSDAEIAALGSAFEALSTQIPISASAMAKVAETAGQLGVAKDQVEEFSTVMSMLGTTTDLTADSAATMLAQFANITGLTDFERLGAAVAELGDATATTASKVVEMSQGMAAAANMAGFRETEILGLSAAVGSLGIEAQAGSTAMSTLIQTLFKAVETGSDKLEDFAAVAGMSAEQFAAAWREDAAGAFAAFVSGLNDVERNGRSAIVILDELGITNARQLKAILGLANAGDLLAKTIAQANQAWEDNTALQEKANIMYETTESKLAMMENAADNLKTAIGDALTPALKDLAETATDAFSWAADFVEENPWLVQAITGAVGAIGLLVGGITAYAAAAAAAKAVQDSLNLSISLCPAVAVAAAIGALVVTMSNFLATASEASQKTQELVKNVEASREAYTATIDAVNSQADSIVTLQNALENAMSAEEKSAADKEVILGLVEQLNEAVPELALAYDAEADALNRSSQELDTYIQLEVKRQLYEANMERLIQLKTEAIDLSNQLEEAEANLAAEWEKGKDDIQTYGVWIQAAAFDVEDLKDQIALNEAEYKELIAAVEAAKIELEGFSGTVKDNASALEDNASAYADLIGVLEQAEGSYALLVKAQDEVTESGSLSISTLETLLDKYPELQKYLEATADGYVLTQGALEDYIETQRAEYQAIYDNAERAAQAVIDNEALEAAGYDATTTSIKAKLQALVEMYKLESSTIQNSTLAEYGDNALGRHVSVSASRQAVSNMQAAQTALANLEAAEKQLATYTRASAMLARDYGSSSSTKSSSGSSSSKSTAATKTAEETAMEALQEWLSDMDHQIFLWSKDESKTDAIVELYQQMQDKVHAMAEQFRAAGYEETDSEIQQLQKLWWGYSDEIGDLRQDMYKRDLAALETALANEEITWEDYLEGRLEAQDAYFAQNSDAWQQAEEDRQAAIAQHTKDLQKQREDAYDEALADLEYFLAMDLITEEEYWQSRIALTETYLTEDSEKRRQAEVAIYQYVKQLREQMQKETETTLKDMKKEYEAQVSELETALKTEKKTLEASYKADQKAQADLYKARKETLTKAYTEEKQILSDWYKEQKQALSDGYKAQKAAAKTAYEEKKAAIQAELDLEKERLNAILDGINQEIQARKELREDEDLDAAVLRAQKSLDAAKAELAFARTDEDRAEWEKEVIRRQEALEQALQNREDTLFYREKELEKQAVQDELTGIQDAAKKAQEQAQADYQATLEGLESGYNAALRELEDSYTARLDGIETRHEAALEQLERGYNDMLARLEDQYNARLRRMESENAVQLERLQARYETEVEEEQQRLIAALGYAEDSYQEALARMQSNCMAAMESAVDSMSALARDAGAVMAHVENESISYIQEVNRISTQNYKNATINVYEARSFTEGESVRLVMKTMNAMDR